QDSPFYSLPLFQHCLSVRDHDKRHNAFCREALLALSPAAARIPVISSGYPPASWKYMLYHRAKESVLRLPKPFIEAARYVRGTRGAPYVIPAPFTEYLTAEMGGGSTLGRLLDFDALPSTLSKIDSAHAFFCFWTVVALAKAYRSRSAYFGK